MQLRSDSLHPTIAEYEALIQGLILAQEPEMSSIKVYIDSYLIIRKIEGEYKATDDRMDSYLAKVQRIPKAFIKIQIYRCLLEFQDTKLET